MLQSKHLTFDLVMRKQSCKAQTMIGNRSILLVTTMALVVAVFLLLTYQKPAAAQDYPVQGFDVSHHQGDINWKKISPQKYQFVYIKATEGGDYKDDKFQDYWLEAREQGLHVGAYHFYRLCKDGKSQTQNFISTVPNKKDALAPVIDLEYDGNCINQHTKEQLLKEIQIMHDALKKHYGKQPVFYTSKVFYNMVLTGNFQQTPIWIREYKDKPDLKDKRPWIFWQYSNTGKILGIEKSVDLNRFSGNMSDWKIYLESLGIKTKN